MEESKAVEEPDWKVEHGRLCKVFNDWCFANGVVQPKVEYPAYFEGGLVGMRATAPIQHREAFVSIPYKMLMTVDAAQRHPILGRIIDENSHLFGEDEKGDWEQLTLVIYIIYEYLQGLDSFWKPYLDLMPDVKFFCHWPKEMVDATQDFHLVTHAEDYQKELRQEWSELDEVLSKYPDVFPPNSVTEQLFYKFYAQVCTRCFGWGLPSTAMIPMADNCNHSDVTIVQEIINKEMHLNAEHGTTYFTKTKMMNDYTINFEPWQYENDAIKSANVKGRYSRANYEANK